MRTVLPRDSVTKKSGIEFRCSRGDETSISHFLTKVETHSFHLKPVRKKNIDFWWSCGFLKLERWPRFWSHYFLPSDKSKPSIRKIQPNSNKTERLPLIIPIYDVLMVPTWWPNISAKLHRSWENEHQQFLTPGEGSVSVSIIRVSVHVLVPVLVRVPCEVVDARLPSSGGVWRRYFATK